MLDVTGSMASSSGDGTTKIQALQNSAKNFVDILLPDTGTPRARIALAPFSANVNLGDTYIQLVTGQPLVKTETTTTPAWAWYMLSPRWSSVFDGEHTPRLYCAEKLKKIAVLMTDGEFNLFYAKNASGNAVQGDSVTQAKALCDGMKGAGIEVYTVGFKLDNATAIATMKYCASGADYAFLAEDSATLEAAFREVAFRAVPIRLTK
jgi:hypothetical protein